jgi:hypothetical protein
MSPCPTQLRASGWRSFAAVNSCPKWITRLAKRDTRSPGGPLGSRQIAGPGRGGRAHGALSPRGESLREASPSGRGSPQGMESLEAFPVAICPW